MPERRLPKKLAAPFVVTVSSVGLGVAAAACHDATAPSNDPRTAPSSAASVTPPTSDVDPVTGRPATSFSFPKPEKIANPIDPKTGEPVTVDAKGSCWVRDKKLEKVTIPCPPELDAKAWATKCADRLVQQRGETCQCEVFANPPYVGEVPCPAHR